MNEHDILISLTQLHAKLDGVIEDVAEIKEETRATNGRVSRLEQWRDGLILISSTKARNRKFWGGVVVGVIGVISGVTAVIATAIDHITK